MKKLAIVLGILLLAGYGLYFGNTSISVTKHTVQLEGLPEQMSGLKIVQLSDLHDAEFGTDQEALIAHVQALDPDLIFVTGDVVDSNRYNLQQSLKAMEGVVDVAPVYYVTGNHEIATKQSDLIKEELRSLGVNVLSNETVLYTEQGASIEIFGIEDPLDGIPVRVALEDMPRTDLVRLTLSHRPEMFAEYVEFGEQLVFSGHAHGGQIRIPGFGGVVAPGQGFMPKYTAGVFAEEGTQMVVSRGLGNSIFPLRVFNRPEIVEIILEP